MLMKRGLSSVENQRQKILKVHFYIQSKKVERGKMSQPEAAEYAKCSIATFKRRIKVVCQH